MSRKAIWYSLFLAAIWLLHPSLGRAAEEGDCLAKSPNRPILLTGTQGLNYDLVGRAIVDAYNRDAPPDKQITACSSEGSLDNLEKLLSSKRVSKDVAFALVQSDVAHAVWMNHPLLEDKNEDRCFPLSGVIGDDSDRLQLITPLYVEVLHILVRPHLRVSGITSLRNRRVWIGGHQSGLFYAAERVLSAAGVRVCDLVEAEKDTKGEPIGAAQAFESLQNMRLDAVFYTGAVPTHIIEDALERGPEIRLLPLDYDLVQRLTSDGSYMKMLIRDEDYGQDFGNTEGTLTVGVQALLVTNNNASFSDVIQRFVKFLASGENRRTLGALVHERQKEQQRTDHEHELQALQSRPKNFRLELLRWPTLPSKQEKEKQKILHKVERVIDREPRKFVELDADEMNFVWDYWKNHEDEVPPIQIMQLATPSAFRDHMQSDAQATFRSEWWNSWILEVTVLVAGCLALVGLFCLKREKLGPRLMKNPGVSFAVAGLVLAWITGSLLMVHLEGAVNENFSHLRTALRDIPFYFVPFRARTALTPDGRLTLKILWWVTVALGAGSLLPWAKSSLNTWVWQPLSGWLEGSPWIVRDHTKPIVIINWDSRVLERISRLRQSDHTPERPAVIVSSAVPAPALSNGSRNIRVVEGEGTVEECLEMARVQKARSVTIFSSWRPADPRDRRKHLDADGADTKTILAILQIRHLSRHRSNGRGVPITAEILSPKNRDVAERAGRGGDINVVSL